MISGRRALRQQARSLRRRGPGWTRPMRKGRTPRLDAECQPPRERTPWITQAKEEA